jgi:hypothetical protein
MIVDYVAKNAEYFTTLKPLFASIANSIFSVIFA